MTGLWLTWPEGRSPGKGYPFCPGCGHDFGTHSPNIGCPTCLNARTPCTVDQQAVFDAIEAAIGSEFATVPGVPEITDPPVPLYVPGEAQTATERATDGVEQRARDLLTAAAMLYAAHGRVNFDTDEDRDLQRRLLAKAVEMVPELPAMVAAFDTQDPTPPGRR